MKQKEILLHRAEIVWIVKTKENPNYDFCEKFYGEEPYLVVLFKKNVDTRKFDSDSNIIEVDNQKNFVEVIFNALENDKVVIVYLENVKENYLEYMHFEFFHIIPDTQICQTVFTLNEMEEKPL